MPVSLALFCAVLVVTALRSLFPTLILPSVLLFFYAGVVKPCWFLRHDSLPLPDLWHHLSFKKTSRKFPWEPAHAERSLAMGRGETFKPSKALTSFRRELNVLPLQLLLALEAGDGQRGIYCCSVWEQKSSACGAWPVEHSPLLSKDQSNKGSQEWCFFLWHPELFHWGKIWKPSAWVAGEGAVGLMLCGFQPWFSGFLLVLVALQGIVRNVHQLHHH